VSDAKPKGKRRWRVRHLVSAVVAVIVICVGADAFLVWHTNQTSKPAVNAANDFLNSLETNNVADAYTQLCAATKKQFSEAQFTSYVKSQPGIDSHSSTSVELSTVNGVASAIVTEDIKNSGGSSQSRGIVLNKEGGTWLVCGQPY
jgi:type II secretory pathway component PulL